MLWGHAGISLLSSAQDRWKIPLTAKQQQLEHSSFPSVCNTKCILVDRPLKKYTQTGTILMKGHHLIFILKKCVSKLPNFNFHATQIMFCFYFSGLLQGEREVNLLACVFKGQC